MGGICSRKRDQQVSEDGVRNGVSGRYCKSCSSKWLGNSYSRASAGSDRGRGSCPSLMELCTYKICEDINKYKTFTMLPRDLSQQIFDELVNTISLSADSIESFRDCALQDIYLGEYPEVNDSWMDVISSQGSSLLSVDLSGSNVTDNGLSHFKDCSNLQALTLNFCDQVTERGLEHISGLSNLASLSFKKSNAITPEGIRAFSRLVNLVKLDLERCSGIHGGLVHLNGLTKLEALNVRCCKCITDSDMKALSGLSNLKELQLSSSSITDFGVSYLKGLHKLLLLNLEGCHVTARCLDSLSDLPSLLYLNLSRCGLSDDGCEKFSDFKKLKVLNLGFNDISDACLVHCKGLTTLEVVNLDSCKIGDEGVANLSGIVRLEKGGVLEYIPHHIKSIHKLMNTTS